MSESKSKNKGPKAVIEMGPLPEEDDLDLAPEAAGEDAGEEGALPAAGRTTAGLFRRVGARIWNYSEENPNTVFYSLVGLVFAILILVLGIWRALIIGVCVAVGAIYGQVRDGKNGIVNFFIDLIEGNNK